MANDCLVTKLKGVVDNNNLDVLGAVYINIERLNETASVDSQIVISTWNDETHDTEEFDVICEDNVKINIGGSQYSTVHTNRCDGSIVASAIGNRSIRVVPKYPLVQFNLGGFMNANIDDLKYCTKLAYLGNQVPYGLGNWTGDGKSLVNMVDMVRLYLNCPDIYWELENLYNMPKLTTFNLNSLTARPGGDWYQLVVSNRIKGRIAGQINCNSTFIYPFNGISTTQYITSSSDTLLKWTQDKAFLKNADYVFEKGYSDGEIAANIAGTGTENWSGISSDHVIKCE